jgi:Dynamin family.
MSTYKEICEEIYGLVDGLGADADGASPFSERLRALKGKLESEHFHIVVMGQFKRGKTTFINSLLGAEAPAEFGRPPHFDQHPPAL